jgi:hypothetical protein
MSGFAWGVAGGTRRVLTLRVHAGNPEKLYRLLIHPHTLIHVLHMAHVQLRHIEKEMGLEQGHSPVAERISELLTAFGYVHVPCERVCVTRCTCASQGAEPLGLHELHTLQCSSHSLH